MTTTTRDAERLVEGDERVSLRHISDALRRLDELGIARLISDAAELVHKAQRNGQALGTITPDAIQVDATGKVTFVPGKAPATPYSAPERLRGAAGDRRSDVFSLGVVLWEALAHRRLYDGKSDDLIKAAVQTSEWRSATEYNANVPHELDAICKKALARDPADRYQSTNVMAAEITAVLDDASYPEGNDNIARYLAREFPEGPPRPGRVRMADTPVPGTLKTHDKYDTGKTEKSKPLGTQTVLGMAPLRDEISPKLKTPSAGVPASSSVPAPGGPTLHKRTPPGGIPPKLPAPVVAPDAAAPRPKTPTPSGAPAWASGVAPAPDDPRKTALGRPESSLSPTILTTGVPAAGRRVAATPPGAINPATTAVTGSSTPAESPLPPLPKRTAVLGSAASASVQAAVAKAGGLPSLKDADTWETPALPPAAKPVTSASPSGVVDAQAPPPPPSSTAESAPPQGVHPASVVALPRAPSRADRASKADVLAGWGWGTDKLDALVDDDPHEDAQRTQRKRLFIAIGGAAGAVLLIAVIAFAFSGGDDADKDKKKPAAVIKPSEPVVQWGSEPPPPPTPTPTPTPTPPPTPPAPPTSTAQATPPAPAPAPAPEPPKTDQPPPPPTPAPAPPAQAATTEPPKPEPPKPEPAQAEPTPPEAKQPEPKKPVKKPEVVAHRIEPKKPPPPKPVDPYATTTTPPKVDSAAAYKTGLQQFARGDSTGALATFKSSLASDPTYAPTWRGIGLVYEKLGKKVQARTAFRKYLELSPGAGDADQIRERLDRLGS